MARFKVLLPTLITTNPYVFQLIRALQVHPEVEVVQYGLQWMKDTKFKFDIVLIQWPEVMLNWKKPDLEDIKFVEETLARWKNENTKIISTVHNSVPHKEVNKYSFKLYELVYNNCDSIIHLGEESKSVLKEKISYSLKSNREYVIPHGNYEWFENSVSKSESRKYLKIDDNEYLVLSLGTIRNDEELNILKRAARYLKAFNSRLLVAGRLPYRSKKSLAYYQTRLALFLEKNLIVNEGIISDDKIQYYLNAADVLFIPRFNSLNSGNVALGYTFGKIVIGPDYGVIGEELKKLGNPVFSYNSSGSLKQSIEQALKLLDSDIGEKNKAYAMTELNWARIADKYVEVFKELY